AHAFGFAGCHQRVHRQSAAAVTFFGDLVPARDGLCDLFARPELLVAGGGEAIIGRCDNRLALIMSARERPALCLTPVDLRGAMVAIASHQPCVMWARP